MIETNELKRYHCVGSDGRPLIVVSCQYIEMADTPRGIRRRPGAIFMELDSGESVRQVDTGCFEVVDIGELVTIAAGDDERVKEDSSRIALCRHEELAERENHLRQLRAKAK